MLKNEFYTIWHNLWLKRQDIDKIILNVTNLSNSQLFIVDEIDEIHKEKILNDFQKLNSKEPIEYIINNANFYSLDFFVDNRVLIPRNETELLVDKAIETIIEFDFSTLIDIWTWSSCIPISVLINSKKVKNCYVTDISRLALEVSKINIKKFNLEKKIKQVKSNLLLKFLSWEEEFDLTNNIIITANLPYIKDNDFENIDKIVLDFEPNLALFWGKKTWFELYEKLIKECILLKKLNFKKNIILFIEIWFDQYEISLNLLKNLWLKHCFFKDNNNIERCIKIIF